MRNKGFASRSAAIVITVVIIIAFAGYVVVSVTDAPFIFNNNNNNGQPTQQSEPILTYGAQTTTMFYSNDKSKGFFFANNDAIRFIAEDGETVFSETYNFTAPKMSAAGEFVCISEQNAVSLSVYNESGLVCEVPVKNPVLNFSVSKMGQVSAITRKDDSYFIQVFSKNGKVFHEGNQPSDKNVIPVLTAISDDGRVLAVVFLDYSGAVALSSCTFYYLDRQESIDYTDAIFGANDDFSDEIIQFARFTNNNRLILLSDKSITCIDAEPKCATIWKSELTNYVDAFHISGDAIAVAYGDPIVNKPSLPVGTVKIFKADSHRLPQTTQQPQQPRQPQQPQQPETAAFDSEVTIPSQGRVTYISGTDKAVVVGRSRNFTTYNYNGSVIFDYTAIADTRDIKLLSPPTKFIAAFEQYAQVIKR